MPIDAEVMNIITTAHLFRVAPRTVSRWCETGRLCYRRTPTGDKRVIKACAVAQYIQMGGKREDTWLQYAMSGKSPLRRTRKRRSISAPPSEEKERRSAKYARDTAVRHTDSPDSMNSARGGSP